jgi:hypothetical protein
MTESVTRVLVVLDRGFGDVSPEALRWKRDLGKAVHGHSLATLKGLYVPAEPVVEGYTERIVAWADANLAEVIDIEIGVIIPGLNIVGHADLLARFKGERRKTVIDLKCVTAVPRWVGLQLGAYWKALGAKGQNVGRRCALQVPPEGSARIIEFADHERDWLAFTYAAWLHRYLAGWEQNTMEVQ